MEYLLPSILRSTISNILNILLISSLVEFKYSKKFTVTVTVIVCALISIVDSYFYFFYDLATLAKFDLIIWVVVGVSCKFLFTDSAMKWLFNLVTALNIFLFVIVISYILGEQLPYPIYAITVLRIILYAIFIVLFRKVVHPLYRQVVDRWQQFLLVAVGILLNYIYMIVISENLTKAITQNLIPILLLSVLMFLVYGTMLWSFGSIIREYEFRAEKEQTRLQEELLSSQLAAYEEFVEASKRHRHDLRHHNQIIMEYLKGGHVEGAQEYLQLFEVSLSESAAAKSYCKNNIANAVLCLYAQKAQVEGIIFAANADIPQNIAMTPPKLGSMLSNILENALEACRKSKANEYFITFTAETEEDSLKIELQNTTSGELEIRNNLPVSTKNKGGTGMKSVLHIVESYHGMLNFRQEGDIFITQIILPA